MTKHPTNCPSCNKDLKTHGNYSHSETGTDEASQMVSCNSCGSRWFELYVPAGIEMIENN